MTVKGNTNRVVTVPAGSLRIHPTAQRNLSEAQIQKRMSDLDLDGIGTLHGVQVDDTYTYSSNGVEHTLTPAVYVIDGQHRVEALKRHGCGEWKVKVELHQDAVDPQVASKLFLLLNRRAVVNSFDLFAQELLARADHAVGVRDVCVKHGLSIGRKGRNGQLCAVSAASRIWNLDRGTTFDRVLNVLVAAYGRTSAAVDNQMLLGLALVLNTANGSLDHEVLIKKLAKYPGGASALIGDAKGLRKIRKGSLSANVAQTIRETYNVGRRSDDTRI